MKLLCQQIKLRIDKNSEINKKVKEIKNKYKIKDDEFIIGSVGRVATEKSLDILIQNVRKLVDANNKIKLMIVGDGPELQNLKQLVKKLKLEKNVILTGKVDYSLVPSYFNTCNIIASFSTSETQGLTIIEGLAASKPTLCINDESFRAMIENSYNGYLFDSDEEFRELVFKLMSDKELYKEMANNAKNSTYKFSKEVFGADILKVYHKAIKARKNN